MRPSKAMYRHQLMRRTVHRWIANRNNASMQIAANTIAASGWYSEKRVIKSDLAVFMSRWP